MKRTLIVAGMLALILTMSVAGTLNPAIVANAEEDDEVEGEIGEEVEVEIEDEEHEQEESSSDSGDDESSEENENDGHGSSDAVRNDTHESETKTKVAVEDDGLEIEIEIHSLDLDDGTYSALLSCAVPVVSLNLEDAFEVEGGKGELETSVELDAGYYADCKLQIQDADITLDVGSFTVVGEEDEQTRESQEDRKREIVENHDARETHERHTSAHPASPGEYEPGTEYVLSATGSADNNTTTEIAEVSATLGVWKSVESLVLFDVLDGTVDVGDKSYTIQLGYAIYSNHGDVLRLRALATDDATGDIVRLSLRGEADGSAELPKESEPAITLAFEGNSGMFKNEVDGWELTMDGYAEAA